MEKAVLHGKVVEVIEMPGHGTLARVQPEDGDEYDAYWVPKTSLKPMPKPRTDCSLAPATDDAVIPTTGAPKLKRTILASTDYASFAPWLSSEDYTLRVMCRPADR